jgi:hypothetical protein
MAEPLQLPMFPDRATLIRVRPERDEARFCQLGLYALQPGTLVTL